MFMFGHRYTQIPSEIKSQNRKKPYAHYYILVNPKVKPP